MQDNAPGKKGKDFRFFLSETPRTRAFQKSRALKQNNADCHDGVNGLNTKTGNSEYARIGDSSVLGFCVLVR